MGDISGDLIYKNGWIAMKKNCNGIIIIYDSSKMENSDIRMWYDHFVNKSLESKQCLILSINNESPPIQQDPKLKKIHCVNAQYKNGKLSSETILEVLKWIGIVFGYHPDAEFGVFD